jgi:hypothetical protein
MSDQHDIPDYESLKRLARERKCKVRDLFALSTNRDPFYVLPYRERNAHWAADLWQRLNPQGLVHVRRLHYAVVSLAERPLKLNGKIYENTDADWDDLQDAFADARLLDLIPADRFTDRRVGEPLFVYDSTDYSFRASLNVDKDELLARESVNFGFSYAPERYACPDPPSPHVRPPVIAEPYRIEVWVEKSTADDILLPLARRLGFTLIVGTGEFSLTQIVWLLERAARSGRPTIIFYISDFDPAGNGMPISVARKIEFLIARNQLDLDVKLVPIALSAAQVMRYGLPRIPLKQGQSGQFEDGGVELDALIALHPGEMEKIVERAVRRYREPARRARDHNTALAAELWVPALDIHREVLAEHGEGLAELRSKFDDMQEAVRSHQQAIQEAAEQAQREAEEHTEAINDLVDGLNAEAEKLFAAIAADLEARLPDVDGVEWVGPEPVDDSDAMFDSSRDYETQLGFYKRHRGQA